MKTITNEGLVFTDELPTKSGWYLCKVLGRDPKPYALAIIDGEMKATANGVSIAVGKLEQPIYWHRLVPAAWLEEAYKEGGNNTADFVLHRPHKDFPESLARRRMEGGVTTQPTPETDAIFQTIAIGDFCKQEDALKLLRSEIERLERERDEARREAHDAKIMD